MTIKEISEKLSLEEVQISPSSSKTEIKKGYTSDLLSDVMANASADSVLITIQAHKNTVAVASLVSIAAIIICNQRNIPEDMINSAAEEDIQIFRTDKDQFTVSGEVYALLEKE